MALEEPQTPVPGFDLKFRWQKGEWEKIFDSQKALIRKDIKRARLDGKFVVYLSCPISARGGGHARTNVEIAKFTERRLLSEWGEQFWILNPCQYQLESKEGFGLLDEHARANDIDLPKLLARGNPTGGDYMRMWTQVLVEDGERGVNEPPNAYPKNTGGDFSAYYFLGPTDVRAFFSVERKGSLGAGIEEYFARKYATDCEFRETYSVPGLFEGARPQEDARVLQRQWEAQRRAFLLFYALRASANFSLGSHDEWLIFTLLNKARRSAPDGGIANQIAGFFDGRQLGFASSEDSTAAGYAVGS